MLQCSVSPPFTRPANCLVIKIEGRGPRGAGVAGQWPVPGAGPLFDHAPATLKDAVPTPEPAAGRGAMLELSELTP